MVRSGNIRGSILIVSASDQFDAAIRRSLDGFVAVDFRKNAAAARRCMLERSYDIVVINAPLPGEPGDQLALDIAQQSSASVLLVIPSEVFEDVLDHVTDYGILVVAKPMPQGRLDKAVRFLAAVRRQMVRLEKKVQSVEEKMEELRIVSRAKCVLVERERVTEDEAHRLIGKQAMDAGISRRRAAESILEKYGLD